MKSFVWLRLVLFFLGILFFLPFFITRFPLYAADINIKELVKLTNESRIRQGLSPLVYNSILSTAAYKKGLNMISKQYWAHFGPNKKIDSPWYFIKKNGYSYEYAGENLAKGFNSALSTHNAWMNSPTHRKNIMNVHYKDIGIAVLQGSLSPQEGPLTLVVQMFGSLSGQHSSLINKSDLEIGNWLSLNKPNKNSVFTSKKIFIEGTTSINNTNIKIDIDRQNIANIGITDYQFDTSIFNRFSNKELTIQASAKLSTDIIINDTTTIFNNVDNYLEKYYVEKLTTTEKEGQVILMVPSHKYVIGVTLKSCDKDYAFTYQAEAYLLAIKNKEFQKINECSKNFLVLQLSDGQKVKASILNIKKSGFETIDKKDLVQTYLGYTQQKKTSDRKVFISWVLLSLVLILLGYIIMTIYYYNFHYRRGFALSLFILLLIGTVKLIFRGGGII